MTALAPSIPRPARRPAGRYFREFAVLGAYAALLLALAIFHPRFFRGELLDTWIDAAPTLALAIGMTLVILAREVDVSIGSQVSVCAVTAALLSRTSAPLPIVAAGTLAVGGLLGAVNGALVAFVGAPSIVVTLGTLYALRGALLWASGGAAVPTSAGLKWFGTNQTIGQTIIVALALSLVGAFAWGMRWLAAGRAVYAVGSDAEAARLAGIRPRRVVFCVFVLMGVMSGLAALLTASRFDLVYPNVGEGKELIVIAAVVVGGVSIAGGRGTLAGAMLGALLLVTVGPTLLEFDVKPQWARAVHGAIILAAAAADGLRRQQ